MKQLISTSVVILCISASIWFISKSINPPTPKQSVSVNQDISPPSLSQAIAIPSPYEQRQSSETPQRVPLKNEINHLLSQQNFSAAVDLFNNQYDELSAPLTQEIQTIFYQVTRHFLEQNKAELAKLLIVEYLNTIQDEQAYVLLARAHVMQENYRDAIDASVSAYGLADSRRQKQIEQYAVSIALNYYGAEQKHYLSQGINENSLYQNGNFQDVLQVLNQLHYLFPENAQLTFKTANLLAATGDVSTAQQYLSALLYTDNAYSQAAENQLNAITKQQRKPQATQQKQSNAQASSQPTNNTPESGIVIALRPSGSSYLVDVVINQSPVTLLLDTGASITALSEKIVDRLDLDKTNRRVRLSTANGTRTSHIYRADSFQLSSITLNKVAIVEIELGRTSRIDGLLGTDVLQQFNYQIDNRTNSLILNPR